MKKYDSNEREITDTRKKTKKDSLGVRIVDFFKLKKWTSLETLEEKSFWILAPIVAVIGLAGLLTAGTYPDPAPTLISAFLCLIIPIVLMVLVYNTKDYHSAYPLFCIAIGAVSIPVTLVFSGGFLSGMPLFCVITTCVTVLCYSDKMRYISFAACLLGNTIAFIFLWIYNSRFALADVEYLVRSDIFFKYFNDFVKENALQIDEATGTLLKDWLFGKFTEAVKAISGDVMFGYYFASFGLYFTLSFIIRDIRKYKFNQDALQKFFDIEKRKEILKQALNNELVDKSEHRKAAIMFADISNFTSVTEHMPSDKISEFLNEFFTLAGLHIHATGGIIDKYIGDCVMAYWFDRENGNCVKDAVDAMIDLRHELVENAENIYNRFGTEINFSVGIAYGDVIFGDIGSDMLHDYTILGDAVNIASRIEVSSAGGEMLLSHEAAMMIKDSIKMEKLESDRYFKGKNKPVDIYKIIDFSEDKPFLDIDRKSDFGYSLHVCGCRGSFPVSGMRFSEYGGETSCYVLKRNDYAIVIDCGTGLKNAVHLLEGCKKIDILFTHVHYDHILGLLMAKFPQGAALRAYGQFGVWSANTNGFVEFMTHPYWPVELSVIDQNNVELFKPIKLDEDVEATFYPSDHPDDGCVIKLICGGKKVAILADCEDVMKLDPDASVGSDLVFFDGMYDDDDGDAHKGWGHGTWQAGVRFAGTNGIKKLIVTHHNPELGDHTLKLKENIAREQSPNISFAKSGDVFVL